MLEDDDNPKFYPSEQKIKRFALMNNWHVLMIDKKTRTIESESGFENVCCNNIHNLLFFVCQQTKNKNWMLNVLRLFSALILKLIVLFTSPSYWTDKSGINGVKGNN